VTLAVLVPLWALCFALSILSLLDENATPGVFIERPPAPDAVPEVLGVAPPVASSTALRAGDRLLRVGNADLRGVGPLELRAIVAREAAGARQPEAEYERAGRLGRTPLPLFRIAPSLALLRAVGTTTNMAARLQHPTRQLATVLMRHVAPEPG